MHKKKVALIHYAYPPVIGGVEFVMQAHAGLLAADGYTAKVFTGEGSDDTPGVTVRALPELGTAGPLTKKVQTELARGVVSPRFTSLKDQIKAQLRRELAGCRSCIAHNVMTMHFNLALTVALYELIGELKGKTKFIIWCHDATLINPHYKMPRPDDYPWNLMKNYHSAARYVVISALRKREFSGLFKVPASKLQIIPNGLDIPSFLDIDRRLWEIALRLDLLKQDLVLFFPSRLLRRKNYELAVKITAALRRTGLSCKLLLTGQPDPHNPATVKYVRELRSLIRRLKLNEQVVFTQEFGAKLYPGFKIGYKELKGLYALSDLLLLTSSSEGFGLPLLEAAARKMPIACSDIAPLPEIAGKDTMLFKLEENPTTIARRLLRFMKTHASHRMFKKIMTEYSWEMVYEKQIRKLVE